MAKNIKEKKVHKDKFGSEFKVHLQWNSKTTSLLDSLLGNAMWYLHWVATKLKRNFRFGVRFRSV